MLNIRLETLCFIIAKAREVQAKEDVVIPDTPSSPSDDWALQVLADHADDMALQEIAACVDDLAPEQQAELVALMWLGRGDYNLDEWDIAVDDAQAANADSGDPVRYLLSHPMVADELEEGLIAHGYSCQE